MKLLVKLTFVVSFFLLPLRATEGDLIMYVEYNDWIIYKTLYDEVYTAKQYRYEDGAIYFALVNGIPYFGEKAQNRWEELEKKYAETTAES